MSILSKDMELRHMPSQYQLQLVKLLDIDDSILGLLMGNIRKNLNDTDSELRFNSTDVDLLRNHSQKLKISPILIFLDEWSTMGIKSNRPTIQDLLKLLIKCELFYAADYLAELLNEPRAQRPSSGPAAVVDISFSNDDEEAGIADILRNLDYPFSNIDKSKNYQKIANNINILTSVKDEQSTASTNHVFSPKEVSDLIKFSTNIVRNEQVEAIDDDNIPALSIINSPIEASVNIPALSIINSPTTEESNNFPVILNSINRSFNEATSDIPDFSGLLNNNNNDESQIDMVESNEQTQTQSSISSIN